MDYKLLRALSIFLQAGLVILLLMLLSLVLFSCTSATPNKATSQLKTGLQQGVMEQRFFNEVRQQREHYKVICISKSKCSNRQLSKTTTTFYESHPKKA